MLIRRTGIPISLSVLYMTLARKLGVQLEPVNFPNHFLLRWCQKPRGYVLKGAPRVKAVTFIFHEQSRGLFMAFMYVTLAEILSHPIMI